MSIETKMLEELLTANDNDPCVCQSGKLFKDCHKLILEGIADNPKKIFYEIIKTNAKRECLFSGMGECSDEIIKAHSVSRKFLNTLSEDDNHVYTFLKSLSFDNINSMYDEGILPEPEKIGINKASVFKGLCKKHDNDLFESFEKEVFECRIDQIQALHLRAVIKEIFVKSEMILTLEKSKVAVKGSNNVIVGMYKNTKHALAVLGQNLSLRDLYYELGLIKNQIYSEGEKQYRYLIFKINGLCPVLNASIVNPAYDLNEEIIQDFNNKDIFTASFAFNVISERDYYYYVFSWIAEKPIEKFMKILEEKYSNTIINILIQLSFAYSENSYIRISWYENLSRIKKERLKKIFWGDIINQFNGKSINNSLRKNVKFIEGRIEEVITNTGLFGNIN